jgi:hypothetical protein
MAYEDSSTGNTLTNLIPTLYVALDTVSRELVGFIPAVTRDLRVARAAIGQTVYSFVAPAATAGNLVAAPLPPDDGEQVIGNVSLGITKARRVPVRWQGEESLQMNSPGGFGVRSIMADQFAQAMRTLVNEIEADLAGLYKNASRAIIPHASTLFSDGLDDAAQVRKILVDNGAPTSDLQCVIDTTAGAALRSLTQLNKANEAGGDTLLRQGVLLDIHGMAIRESAAVVTPAAIGTESGATLDTAAYAIGDTTVNFTTGGTGTILAGDIIEISSDTANRYVNKTLITPHAASCAMVLNAPGLRKAITLSSSPTTACRAIGSRSMAFARSAIVLATRMPALPEGGDMAADRTTITDPRSGLSFEVSMYKQYRQVQYEVSIAWGVKCVKEEHVAILCGA